MSENERETTGGQAAFVREVERLTLGAVPTLVRPLGEPADVVYFLNPCARTVTRRLADPGARHATLETTADVARWALGKCGPGDDEPKAGAVNILSEIYYSPDGITARRTVRTDGFGERDEFGRMELPLTVEFLELVKAAGPTADYKSVYEFDIWMRSVFGRAVDPRVLKIFTNLESKNDSTVKTSASVRAAGLSQSVRQEIVGEDSIPETVTLNIRVFNCVEVEHNRYPVECAVDLRKSTPGIRLIPIGDAATLVRWEAFREIEGALVSAARAEEIHVYRGAIQGKTGG